MRNAMTHKRFYSRDPLVVTERILAAAEAEFAAQGFTGASTNRIAEYFGGSKATVFRYYPTKAELFVDVMRRICERLVAEVDWDALDRDDPRAWLTGFAVMSLKASVREDALFVGRMIIAHGHDFPVLRETFFSAAIAPVLSKLAGFLEECTRKGVLCCPDHEDDARRYFDLAVSGWTNRALFGLVNQESFFALEASRATSLFLDGCRSPLRLGDHAPLRRGR
jgi:TetR/AcrR family transcriptional repressor of mexJK operon